MTPNAVGFVTRAEAGLRAPTSVSRNITPQHGGLAVHWGGGGSAPVAHADCLKRWKAWQDFHMTSRGWTDTAYNFGFCNHGYIFAGRGLGVRSGAQGTSFGNQNFYAACWIGGSQSRPTRLAFEALLWLIQAVRNSGAGLAVRPHSWFKATSCPGNDLRGFILPYHGNQIQEEDMTPEQAAMLEDIWQVIGIGRLPDGTRVLRHTSSNLSHYLRTVLPRSVADQVGELDSPSLAQLAKAVADELDRRTRLRLG